eukprot:COSAG01_NODE_1651_length_9623_cov_6.232045_16_plen_226_part_00
MLRAWAWCCALPTPPLGLQRTAACLLIPLGVPVPCSPPPPRSAIYYCIPQASRWYPGALVGLLDKAGRDGTEDMLLGGCHATGVGTLEGQLRAGAHHVADLRCVYFDEDEQEEQSLCRPPHDRPPPPGVVAPADSTWARLRTTICLRCLCGFCAGFFPPAAWSPRLWAAVRWAALGEQVRGLAGLHGAGAAAAQRPAPRDARDIMRNGRGGGRRRRRRGEILMIL